MQYKGEAYMPLVIAQACAPILTRSLIALPCALFVPSQLRQDALNTLGQRTQYYMLAGPLLEGMRGGEHKTSSDQLLSQVSRVISISLGRSTYEYEYEHAASSDQLLSQVSEERPLSSSAYLLYLRPATLAGLSYILSFIFIL